MTDPTLQFADRHAPPPRRPGLGLAVLCLGVIMIVADNTIVNVALPTLVRELGASTRDLQWIVDSYVLSFAAFLLPLGSIGDRWGRKRNFLVGVLAFSVCSAGAAFAGTVSLLITWRVGMGIAAAAIYPSTLALVSELYPDPQKRKGAIAAWAAASGVAVVIGPIAGGWLVERFWWGSMFLVNVPLGIIACLIGGLILKEGKKLPSRFDVGGAVLSTLGVGAIVWGLIEAPAFGWLSTVTLSAFFIGFICLSCFVAYELRRDHPMLPLWFFRFGPFRGGVLAMAIGTGCLFGFVFSATQFLQLVLGYKPLAAGLHYLPFACTMIIGAVSAPLLATKTAEKNVVVFGLGSIAAALLLSTQITVASHYLGVIIAIVMLMGLGMGMTASIATEAIVRPLPADHLGVGSAVNDTSRELGGALGVAAFGSVFASAYRGRELLNATTALPAEASALVKSTPTAAMMVADQLGPQGQPLRTVVQSAVTHGLNQSGLISGVACLIGMVVVAITWRSADPNQDSAQREEQLRTHIVPPPDVIDLSTEADSVSSHHSTDSAQVV